MHKNYIFDESAWCHIDYMLPDDETIKQVILDDFLWFMNRPQKYKSERQKIEAYIHHLKLKSNPAIQNSINHMDVFKNIDTEKVKAYLLENVLY